MYSNSLSLATRLARQTFACVASAAWLFAMTGSLKADDTVAPQILPTPATTVSTVPSNGDVNPYGVAFVPYGYPQGTLQPEDILVSNFNNNQNLQGTGSTIVPDYVARETDVVLVSAGPHTGLSTALNISHEGPIFVGNFPSVDGTCQTATPGSILIVNANGQQIGSLANTEFINGPWDSTFFERGDHSELFIANALSGTISRIDMKVEYGSVNVERAVVIASGYTHRCDPATFVVSPTGLVYDADRDTLFVASTGDNAVFAVGHAGTATDDQGRGEIIYQDNTHLHGALAMTQAPNGHLLVTNSDGINPDPNQPSEIVEFTKDGKFVAQLPVDPALGGAFGLGFGTPKDDVVRFAAVDDNTATLTIWSLLFDTDKH